MGDAPAEGGGDAPTLQQLAVWYGELKLVHKRLRDAYDEAQAENKRFKTTTSNVVDELLCPITQQLPADPVTAEDGRVYERAAIEEWIEKKKFTKTKRIESFKSKKEEVELVRSPSTNENMGLDLTDAVQIRITIQQLVQSGLVDDDKATAVKNQLAVEKAANEGDGDALYEMGRKHKAKIFKENGDWDDKYRAMTAVYEEEESWGHWWKKGARLHNPKCMAAYGQYLTRDIDGDSLWTNSDELVRLGERYLYQAATNVDLAAYTIGCAVLSRDILIDQQAYNDHWRTYYDLPEEERIKWFSKANLDEAKYWLKKVVHRECEHKILGIADMLDAQEKLEEIEEHEKAKQQ